jgi:ATP-dependent helicase/nuclease subunit B
VREGRDNWRRLTEELTGRGDSLGGLLHDMLVCDARLTERKQTCAEFREEIALAYPLFGIQDPPHSLPNALADKHALQQANQTMDDIVLSARMSERGVLSFAQFVRLVTAGWRTATYCPPLDRERVAVLEPYDARQRAASFVAVMGLTERVFPRQMREDPFFRDEERAALRTFARLPLEDQQERAEEERLLFYLAVTAPAGSEARLVLTYPRTTEESDALPSFYVDEVRACFAGEDAALLTTETCTLSDVAPHPEACVTERDRLLALCERFVADPAKNEAAASDPAVRAVLATRHLPLLPRLTAEAALREQTRRRRYGITELEAYLRCPFQHLMRHGLMLRPEPDGGGAADRGTLFHTVLRRTFRRRAAEDRARNTPEPDALRETLHAELETCLGSHRVDASPVRRAMMERALRDALSGFSEREACYHEVFGMTPSHFELAFGTEEEPTRLDDEENTAEPESPREYDPASTPRPLVIASQDGTGDIHLCGAIDRVDLSPDDNTALVMDYKLGSTVEFSVIKEGRSLQMPLYLLAIEQLWGKTGAVACYDSPRDNGRNRFYRVEHVGTQRFRPLPNGENGKLVKPVKSDEYTETLSNAIQSVRQAVQGIAAAEITPLPGKHCNHCDFVDVCRFHQDNVHDGEPFQSSCVSS